MNQIKGSEGEHMKFLTFGTSLHKLGHPIVHFKKYKIWTEGGKKETEALSS